jgi:hypothetical protein
MYPEKRDMNQDFGIGNAYHTIEGKINQKDLFALSMVLER